MGKGLGWARMCLLGVCLFVVSSAVVAQTISPEEQYKSLIRVDQDIQPLGAHPFGENISLYNGSLSFQVTDVSARGNGPLLQLTRSYEIKSAFGAHAVPAEPVFADWVLDLPHIQTFTAEGAVYDPSQGHDVKYSGWQVQSESNGVISAYRCKNFDTPPRLIDEGLHINPEPTEYTFSQWWSGYHLVVPGHGNQDLLKTTNTTYPAITKNHWRLSCIKEDQTANGEPGDGFVAHAPDGTAYYFNELIYRAAPAIPGSASGLAMSKPNARSARGILGKLEHPRMLASNIVAWLTGSELAHAERAPGGNGNPGIVREMAYLLVTKIEDRFGNTLTYHYDPAGLLTGITASDGRSLTLNYNSTSGLVASVTLASSSGSSRTWNYSYGSIDGGSMVNPVTSLTKVTLPEGHSWSYQFAGFAGLLSLASNPGTASCLDVGTLIYPGSGTGTITGPSGLTGTFTVEPMKHARSYVATGCGGVDVAAGDTPSSPGTWAITPDAWYSYTLTKRTISGAGLPTGSGQETWTYAYSTPNPSWANCSGSCPTTETTTVTRPDGSVIKRTFSNKYDVSESHLLRTDFYANASAGTPLRSVIDTYAEPGTIGLPTSSAGILLTPRINSDQATEYSPLSKSVIDQDGDTYTWQVDAFNAYAQVIKTDRFNSIVGQVPEEEATTYLNDTTNWVLGLPLKHTNLSANEVVSENLYNTDDLLASRKSFGQTVMSYTWNGAGQLASFTDANGNTTTLGNYKRGIPQTVDYPPTAGYPNGTSEHLTVDDFGQITSITNQAGDTTDYAYDASGRLTGIAYPGNWNPETFTYAYVTSTERGLGANHWKRTVSQGNARHVTYYDALLRPVLTDTYIAGDGDSHITAGKTYNWKGLTTHASWPVSGSPAWASAALAPGVVTTYDALGRITSVSQHSEPDPNTQAVTVTTTKTVYLSGARKQVTDPAGHVTTASYQVFDTPSYKMVIKEQAPEGIIQTISRNLYGMPTTITQSGPSTPAVTKHLYYNAQHRLCRSEEPETGSTVMHYDAVGNLVWSAEGQPANLTGCGDAPAAARTFRTYDAMNRLTSVTYPDHYGDTTITYDAMGRTKSSQALTASGLIQWDDDYDTLGHLTSETLAVDGHSWPIRYGYDGNGHVSTLTYPDGKKIAYAPDALGRADKAGIYAHDAGYFPDGSLEYFNYEGGQNTYLIERNPRHLIRNLTVGGDSDDIALVYSEDFTYDKDANIIGMTDLTPNGERNETLTYDALNRLTKADAPQWWGTTTFTYDALDNIRTLANEGIGGTYLRTYQYDASNRLTAIMSGSAALHQFVYDAQGDVVQSDSQTRVFDAAHRLRQIPGVATYVYDAGGRRVKKTDASGNSTYYAYDRAGHLLYQWDAGTRASTDYVYLGKKLVAEIQRPQGAPVLNAPGMSVDHNPNDGAYTVSWTGTTGASYTLQEQINGGAWHTVYQGTATNKAETDKAPGGYRYRVQACDGDCSDWGQSVTVGVTPTEPAITLPAGIQSGRYTVSWTRPASATQFDVQQQANGGSWQTIAADTTATSISLAGDTDGSYVYRVRAKNAYGARGWATSGTVTVLHPPAAVSSVSAPSVSGTGSYAVSWSAVSKASSYVLQQQVNGGGWSTVYSGANLTMAFSGKADGTTYGYRVQACNAGGCGSSWSAVAAVEVVYPPSAPTSANQVVQGSSKLISDFLKWDAVSRATYYEVKIDSSTAIAYSGSDTEYRIASATPPDGVLPLHTAHLRACNIGGCSAWVTVYPEPPAAPTLSGPSNNASGSYTLSWAQQQTASTYVLYEQIGSGSYHVLYSGAGLSRKVTGKANGNYAYYVKACAETQCGATSSVLQVTVLHPPAAPASLSAPATSSGGMAVSWSSADTATSYVLQVQVNAGNWSTVYTGAATSYATTVLASGNYVYRVHACNAGGCSAYTSSRTVVVTLPPSVPTLSVPASNHTGSYTVSWSVIGSATSYTLQQRVNSGGWSTSYSGSGTHESYSGRTNGATYGYRIRACNAGGCGAWSATQSVKVEIPPASPTNVRVVTMGSARLIKVYVKWDAASGATSYQLKLNGLDQATVYSGTATSYLVGSASLGGMLPMPTAAYVRACDSHGCSAWAKNVSP